MINLQSRLNNYNQRVQPITATQQKTAVPPGGTTHHTCSQNGIVCNGDSFWWRPAERPATWLPVPGRSADDSLKLSSSSVLSAAARPVSAKICGFVRFREPSTPLVRAGTDR